MRIPSLPPGSESRGSISASEAEVQPDLLAEHPSARFWKTPLVLLPFVLLTMLALIVSSPDVQPYISVYTQLLSMAFCVGCTVFALTTAAADRTRWAWGFLALAQGLYVLGDVVIIWLTSQPTVNASAVSLADLFFLPLAPLTALGAIFFPAAQSTPAKQVRVIVDVGIAVGALLGIAVVFLIAPRLENVANGSSSDLIFILYPVTDLTLLLTLIALLVRGIQTTYRPVLFWLLLGMLFLIYADSSYNYFSLPEFAGSGYAPGTFYIDIFWMAAALSFSLAPLSWLAQRKQPDASWKWLEKLSVPKILSRPSGLANQFLLLVVPVLVMVGLLVYINYQPEQQSANIPLVLLTFLVVLLIITRQILTQRDLVDARIATRRAEQLDALKDQFITSVNHELRTPLMTMTGYVELLGDPEMNATPAKRQEMLEYARRAGTQLVHLVKSILDTRRIDQEAAAFGPEVVPLSAAVEAAVSLLDLHESDPSQQRLSIHVPSHLAVWGEQVRVQQVLTNLLSNAIKYSPKDAPIRLEAQIVNEKGTRALGLRSARNTPRQMVEITVRDYGLGIPPDEQELLFRRFVRLARDIASNVHGTGMGLYLCRVYAEAMDGSIWVESAGIEGEGSTFHLRLPLVTPRASSPSGAFESRDAIVQ